ncbi:Glycosyl-phosphatidylinositol-anchored molecule-like protein [Tupaia chinensis]|uniref:Glycosyl-phosphatidylinositol-anchored molecule-like protein n=1 Tax=Tupaia chinensis TaxID=246437 RepID=L9KLQ9_TUPCH|nr:Glycosyl-phosphatidylinositol-anchored molecule-like protein [Tupaia chinensis]
MEGACLSPPPLSNSAWPDQPPSVHAAGRLKARALFRQRGSPGPHQTRAHADRGLQERPSPRAGTGWPPAALGGSSWPGTQRRAPHAGRQPGGRACRPDTGRPHPEDTLDSKAPRGPLSSTAGTVPPPGRGPWGPPGSGSRGSGWRAPNHRVRAVGGRQGTRPTLARWDCVVWAVRRPEVWTAPRQGLGSGGRAGVSSGPGVAPLVAVALSPCAPPAFRLARGLGAAVTGKCAPRSGRGAFGVTRFQLLQVTMLPLALVLSVVLPPMDSNVTNVTTAGQSHWTYSLVCHDCAAINDFNCGNQRVCPYEIRRCLTIAIRK